MSITEPDHEQATRLLLLEASVAMFARRGFESTTLSALASTVEVTTGAVYGNFESKQDLFVSAVLHSRRIVESTVDELQPTAASLEERGAAYLKAIASLTISRPDVMAFRMIVPMELARNEDLRAALNDELNSRLELCERIMARRPSGRRAPLSRKGRDLAITVLSLGEGLSALLQGDPGTEPLSTTAAANVLADLIDGSLFANQTAR
jgi:AcrR family transcriptional regulator